MVLDELLEEDEEPSYGQIEAYVVITLEW